MSSKYGPKLGHPNGDLNIARHSNLSPSLNSTLADWSWTAKTIVLTDLDQVVVFQSSQLGAIL